MFECTCGEVFGNPIAYRNHRKACMSYETPKPVQEDESAKPMDFDSWIATHDYE